MENYQKFLDRINSFEKKCWNFAPGDFTGNLSLAKKVKQDNSFRPFYGDTVVFDLDVTTKERLAKWLDKLYAEVPECFANRLVTDTFHMTLHDLSNAEVVDDIANELAQNEKKVQLLCEKLKAVENTGIIRMRSKCVFNMVNTSLVLGLYPADEVEYEKLMNLYEAFNEVKELPYPLTPHITLAYYNVHGFDETSAKKLEKLVYHLNSGELGQEMEIVLEAKELFYQHFNSMNHYINVLPVFGE